MIKLQAVYLEGAKKGHLFELEVEADKVWFYEAGSTWCPEEEGDRYMIVKQV